METQLFSTIPADAQHAGISVIFQEFNLVPHLSVAENIFINREPTRNGMIDWENINQRAGEALKRLEIDIDPRVTSFFTFGGTTAAGRNRTRPCF